MGWKMLIPLAAAALVGCDPGPKSSRGFRLPDGDVAAGQAAFVQLQCSSCHSVAGTELPEPGPSDTKKALDVRLGGKVLRVRTYGELVTAVVHPSHDLAQGHAEETVSVNGVSLMTNVNDVMTVQQMIDVVAFLQSTYTEYLPADYDPYFP